MRDQKRQMRQLKRDLKRSGNRQRRRYLKNVEAEADEFDFGRRRSNLLNGEAGTSHKRNRRRSDEPTEERE